VNATSIKVLENLDFDIMPSVGLNIMVIGITTKTVKNIDGKHHLEFYAKENLGEREPWEFWVDVTYDPNLRLHRRRTPGKHVVRLEDISLISTCDSVNKSQSGLNLPWLQGNSGSNSRSNRTPRGATPRSKKWVQPGLASQKLWNQILFLL